MASPREHLAAVFKQCVEDATESLMDKVVEARENDDYEQYCADQECWDDGSWR